MAKTAILYIANTCNLNCVFCLEEDRSWKGFVDPTTQEVYDETGRLWERGARHITFMGGETFFRKDLGGIIAHAKDLGFTRIGVTTNGTILSKSGFLGRLVDMGLDFIELSIHAHTPELAEAISGESFTFARQAAALEEVRAARLPAIVNVVVCRENKDQLGEVARYVHDALSPAPMRFKLKFVSLQGLAAEQSRSQVPISYRDVDFVAVGDFLQAKQAPFNFYNVPLCRLGDHARRSHELSTLASDETYFDYDHRGTASYYDSGPQFEGRVWPGASCGACSLRPVCPGIEETYRLAHGTSELSASRADAGDLLLFALMDRGLSTASAKERLTQLAAQPRPEHFVRPAADGAVRFRHLEEPEPLDLLVEAAERDKRAFAKTRRFALSYRRWRETDPQERPRVAALLSLARGVLDRADAEGLALDDTRRRVAAIVDGAWVADPLPRPRVSRPTEMTPLAASQLRRALR